MASKTPNLGLIKPAKGEYKNSWDVAENANKDVLDEHIGDLELEMTNARGTEATLNDRLNTSLNTDGSLKPVPEVEAARSSTIYGYVDNSTIDDRLELGDREVFYARQQAATLLDNEAFMNNDFVHNCVVSAPSGFMAFTTPNVYLNGAVTPIVMNINGYKQVIRTNKSITLPVVTDGTYYIYAQYSATGEIVLDKTTGGGTGVVGAESGLIIKFTDSTQNFITLGIQPGDVLEITSLASNNKGQYIVETVVDATTIYIKGLFVETQTSLNYKISNPLAPVLNYDDVGPTSKRFAPIAGKIYVGYAIVSGNVITSAVSFALKGRYEKWTSVTGGNFTQALDHNIGYVPSKVQFFASQTNDFSQPVEPLSVADMTASTLQRSVICNMTDLLINVKNATTGVFYKDFNGVTQTSGYLLTVAER
jgi:hypothetical protein